MDNQFKNMKTHARHLSKGMWYEWRMKLLDGLRDVLVGEAEGLKLDENLMQQQESAVENVLPALLLEHEQLLLQFAELERHAQEIADCDQEELSHARRQIVSSEQQIQDRKERIAELKSRSKDLDSAVEDAQDVRVEYLQAIKEAQRVREEHRGWSGPEVNRLKCRYSCDWRT